MKIMVTGATGHLGRLVTESLLKHVPPSDLAVSVRNPEKASDLAARGVDVRQGDFDQPDDLVRAFTGIDRLLVISTDGDNETRIRQHTHAVQAAVRAGVKHLVYTSIAQAETSAMFLAEVHRQTEAVIRNSGLTYTLLRHNWYLENELSGIGGVRSGAPWVTAAGAGRTGWALRRDYAEAAAAVLRTPGHENKVYELSSPPASQEVFAQTLGEILGVQVPVVQTDDAGYTDIMAKAGVPEAFLPFVTGIQQGIRAGALDVVSDDFTVLLGRPVTPLKDALTELLK